jgi:protein-tyrosine phosphatase
MSEPGDSAPPRGMLNLRDVGGLATADGRRVALGRLYRSDAPIVGDPAPALRPWPPRTVVDLRSAGEAALATHPLASSATTIINIPLFRDLDPARMARRTGAPPADLATIYRALMRGASRSIVEVVEVVARSPGPLLLHCAAGKDRTGVATAVTLAAVGVRPEAIVGDYVRTEESLEGLPERLAHGWSDTHRDATMRRLTVERPELLRAPAAAIEAVLETLESWPGGTTGWLLHHGLTPDVLDALSERLTVPVA